MSFEIKTVKLGCTIDNYETQDETVKTETFETIKEARKALRDSLKNGFVKHYENYFNSEDHTELQRNF
jgi:hypothetical protein